MSAGLLFDSTRCIDCGACSAACKEQNALPLPVEPKTTAYTWTTVEQLGGVNVRRLCMHCLDPTCVSVCPVGALSRTAEGAVVYDAKLCIGCRYCIMACPFGVPKYQWDSPVPVVGKCILCSDRVGAGQPTACAAACPTGATLFGERDALLAEAHARIGAEPGQYAPEVYGEKEAGGTSVLMLSSVPFDALGMSVPPQQPLPMLTWRVLSGIPDFVAVAASLLFGIHWITHRREEVAAAEGAPPPAGGEPERSRPGFWRRLIGAGGES